MGFKRITSPAQYPSGGELTRRLVAIGFRFADKPPKDEPNIEETLIACSIEGVAGDYRALSLLSDWFDVHSERINADHLIRLVQMLDDTRVKKYWIACAQWKKSDSRFKKLRALYDRKRVKLIESESDFLLKRHGEDPRFKGTAIIVHAKALRSRPADIEAPERIAQFHRAFHYRLLIGPTYRADLIAALEKNPDLSAAELARCCYSSFSAAWQAKRDFEIIQRAS